MDVELVCNNKIMKILLIFRCFNYICFIDGENLRIDLILKEKWHWHLILFISLTSVNRGLPLISPESFSLKWFFDILIFFFPNQCSLINNSRKLPLNRTFMITSFLRSVNIKDEEILDILKSLDININKAHRQNDTSIMMLKLPP